MLFFLDIVGDSDEGASDCPSDDESTEDSFCRGDLPRDTIPHLVTAPGVTTAVSDRVDPPLAMPSSTESSAFMTFIQKQSQQFDDHAKLMRLLVEKSSASEKKRKNELEDDDEEDVVLIDETFKVLDDAHQKICFEIREKLRPINRYLMV